jgi:hypothetical protein
MDNVRGYILRSLTCTPSTGSPVQGKTAPDTAAVKTSFNVFHAKFEQRTTVPAAG